MRRFRCWLSCSGAHRGAAWTPALVTAGLSGFYSAIQGVGLMFPSGRDQEVCPLRSHRVRTEAEHPGGLGVDDQLELARLHHRQVRRFGALEDAAIITRNGISRSEVCATTPAFSGSAPDHERNRYGRRRSRPVIVSTFATRGGSSFMGSGGYPEIEGVPRG
jgi:hypothetical protein